MDTFFTVFLIIHIAAGSIALGTGAVAMFTRKGGKPHKTGGRIYYISMVIVALTAFVMSVLKSNQFLLSVGIFSLYMAYTGNRAVKRHKKEQKIKGAVDIVFMVGGFLGGSLLLWLGLPTLVQGLIGMNIVFVVFGTFTVVMVLQDLNTLRLGKQFDKKRNLLLHISRMGGTYIATFTAFTVTNVQLDPSWLLWLAPTAVGSFFMTTASRKWRKKLYPKGRSTGKKTISNQTS